MKYSSFKIEDPLLLEDGILSDGPDSSCIYKRKYDVATYREKAPHLSYGEKVDLIKNVFVPEKTFDFQKQLDLLNMSDYCCFPGFVILPVKMHLTACLVFCLVMISLLKLLGLTPSGVMLPAICQICRSGGVTFSVSLFFRLLLYLVSGALTLISHKEFNV